MSLNTTLYRSLLRTARLFDANPAYKAFLRQPLAASVPAAPRIDSAQDLAAVLGARLTNAYFQGMRYYNPVVPLYEFVRFAFRTDFTVVEASGEDGAADGAGQSAEADAGVQQDVAIALLSRLQRVLSAAGDAMAAHGEGHVVPLFTELQQLQLTPLDMGTVRHGCMLLDHPATTTPGHGVHILLAHPEDKRAGMFCVNRPLTHTVADVFDGDASTFGALAGNLVFHGGEDSRDLRVLHPYPELEGAVPIAPGLCVGCSLEAANAMIEAGEAEAHDFKFVVGYSTFPLTEEGGLSIPSTYVGAEGAGVALLALLPPDAGGASMEELLAHSYATWANAMRALGGEFEEFATVPGEAMHAFNVTVMDEMDTEFSDEPDAPAAVQAGAVEGGGWSSDGAPDSSDSDSDTDSSSGSSSDSDSDSDAGRGSDAPRRER